MNRATARAAPVLLFLLALVSSMHSFFCWVTPRLPARAPVHHRFPARHGLAAAQFALVCREAVRCEVPVFDQAMSHAAR
jgi:hypothetical protein